MKIIFRKIWEVIKIILWMIFNPRFLICFGIGWIITNGWAYIALGIAIYYELEWLSAIASGYLTLLWFPATPEKIATTAIAVFLLKKLFPNDTKTLGVLTELYRKTVEKFEKQRKRKNKGEEK